MPKKTSSSPRSGTPLPKGLDERKLRPSERVLEYLKQEFDRPDLHQGARLPSNRELAQRLQVSIPTVQNVLKRLSRDGRLEARHGSGTYLTSPHSNGSPLRVGIAALLHPDEKLNDAWLSSIISGLMPASLHMRPTTFVGIPPEKFGRDESVEALLQEIPRSDGLIVMPYTLMPADRDRVVAEYEKAGKPVVSLQPPQVSSTANFVSTDYFGPAESLGRVWSQSGRKNIALFTMSHHIRYTISNNLRLLGLTSGIGEALGNSTSLRLLHSETMIGHTNPAYETMKAVLEKGSGIPDAMLVANSNTIPGIKRALEEAGLKCPEDISLVSVEKMPHPALERTLVDESGPSHSRHLMEMLIQRIQLQGASVPGVYLPAQIQCGNTTRPEENALLQQIPIAG